MAAPGRVTSDERDRIIATLTETENVRETARIHGRSVGTVSKIGTEEGIHVAERSRTKNATHAKAADNTARRAELQSLLLDDAHRLRAQLWEACKERKALVVSDGSQVGAHVEVVDVEFDEPPFSDKQRIMTSIGIAVDKVVAIDKHDNRADLGASDVDDWLRGQMGESVQAAA